MWEKQTNKKKKRDKNRWKKKEKQKRIYWLEKGTDKQKQGNVILNRRRIKCEVKKMWMANRGSEGERLIKGTRNKRQ